LKDGVLPDTKFEGRQQENIFPATLVNIISEVAVKRHGQLFDLMIWRFED
jgi:hypothetical protein